MKKIILFIAILLILSQQALASKDYNLTNCEKPRYGWGSSSYCIKNLQHGEIYLDTAHSPGDNYPTHKVVLEGFTGPYYLDIELSCYRDLWNPEGTTLKKLGLTSPKNSKGNPVFSHLWLHNSHIYSYWQHIMTATVGEYEWMCEWTPEWIAYGCPHVQYRDYFNIEYVDYAWIDLDEDGPDICK